MKLAICKQGGGYTVRKLNGFGPWMSLGEAYDKNCSIWWSGASNIFQYCVHETLDDARNATLALKAEIIEIVEV